MIKSLLIDYRTEIFIVAIIIATIIISILFNWFLKRFVKENLIKHGQDLTRYLFIRHIVTALIYVIGFSAALVQIPELKIVGHSLLAGAGVISLIAGLASQQALSNIMSGILIVVFKPFRINDKITLKGSYTGIVEDINLRQVVIRDYENNRIIIPNSVVSSDIIVNANLSENKICKMIEIGIGYESDIDLALKIMQEEVLNHPLHIDNRTQEDKDNNVPEVIARVVGLGESSVNLKVWAWANNAGEGFILNCDLLKSIKTRFDKEGIEIPFPQRTISYKEKTVKA